MARVLPNRFIQAKGIALHLCKGFNLIELMIVVAIVGITAAVAAPNFASWIADTKTRSIAEAIQNGVRLAQGEAVKRGVQIEFVLTDAAPTAAGVAASATGRNWVIQSLDRSDGTVDEFVQGAMLEGVSSASLVSATAPSVTFNSFGRVEAPAAGVVYTLSNTTGGTRTLQVRVSASGAVRMCDPAINRATSSVGC